MEEKIRVSDSILNKMNDRFPKFRKCYIGKNDGRELVEEIIDSLDLDSPDYLFNLNAKVLTYNEFMKLMLNNGFREFIMEYMNLEFNGIEEEFEDDEIIDWITNEELFHDYMTIFYEEYNDVPFDWFVSEQMEYFRNPDEYNYFVVFYDKLNESKKKFNLKESIKKNISKRIMKNKQKMIKEGILDKILSGVEKFTVSTMQKIIKNNSEEKDDVIILGDRLRNIPEIKNILMVQKIPMKNIDWNDSIEYAKNLSIEQNNNWNDSIEYAKNLSIEQNNNWRLPTNEESEKLAQLGFGKIMNLNGWYWTSDSDSENYADCLFYSPFKNGVYQIESAHKLDDLHRSCFCVCDISNIKKTDSIKESVKRNISKRIAERKRLMNEEKLSDYEDMKPDTWWADDKATKDVFRTTKSRDYYGSDKYGVKFRKDDENAIQNTYNKIVSKPENLFAYLEHRGGTDGIDEFIPNKLAKEFLFNEEFHKMFNEWLKEKLNKKFYNRFNAKPNKYADQLIDLVDEDVYWDGFVNSTSDDEHCREDYEWCIRYAPISDNGKLVSASQYQFDVPKWNKDEAIIFYLFSKLIENDRLDETGIPKYVMDYLIYEIEPKMKKYNDKRQKDAIKKQKEVSNDYESDMYDSTDDLEEGCDTKSKLRESIKAKLRRKLMERKRLSKI